jgi:hypothetical protein
MNVMKQLKHQTRLFHTRWALYVCAILTIYLLSGCASKITNKPLGIKFGSTKEKIAKSFPNGVDDSDKKSYVLSKPYPQYNEIRFSFNDDGAMCEVCFTYEYNYLKEAGNDDVSKGVDVLEKILISRFGKPNIKKEADKLKLWIWQGRGALELKYLMNMECLGKTWAWVTIRDTILKPAEERDRTEVEEKQSYDKGVAIAQSKTDESVTPTTDARPSDEQVEQPAEPELKVTDEEVISDYKSNKYKADKKYKGKILGNSLVSSELIRAA